MHGLGDEAVTRIGPRKVVAAEFLRELARNVERTPKDPKKRAEDLRLLADCIEGKARWAKGMTHSFAAQQKINLAAYYVEHRPPDCSVGFATDHYARQVAQALGRTSDADIDELVRHIRAARKRQRKAGWPLVPESMPKPGK